MRGKWENCRKLAVMSTGQPSLQHPPETISAELLFSFILLSDTRLMVSLKASARTPQVRQIKSNSNSEERAQSAVSLMLYFNDLKSTPQRCEETGHSHMQSAQAGVWLRRPLPHSVPPYRPVWLSRGAHRCGLP